MAVEIESATIAAIEFAGRAYPGDRVLDPLLEEVEISTDDRLWLITLSWVDPERQSDFIKSLGPLGSGLRVYKVFHVRRDSGEVTAMKIRETQAD